MWPKWFPKSEKDIRNKSYKTKYRANIRFSYRIPKSTPTSIVLILVLSVLVHVAFLVSLEPAVRKHDSTTSTALPVKINYIDTNTKKAISEIKQAPTEPPKKFDVFGYENHSTEKETVISKSATSSNLKRQDLSGFQNENEIDKKIANKATDSVSTGKAPQKDSSSDNPFQGKTYKNLIESISSSSGDSTFTQDFDGSDFTLGESLSVNMMKHPLMSYFSKIRQSVELAYFNPSARRIKDYMERKGLTKLQGKAVVLVEIDSTGQITQLKIISSTGHTIIDNHWQQVLKDSGPFAPLPKNWTKKELKFSYGLDYKYM